MSATYSDNLSQIIADRYQVGNLLGKGGMASVYRGFDLNLERQVAIKITLPQFASSAEFLKRFKNEARSAARLSCPQIVNVFDWGVDNSQCFIIMELVDGVDLKTLQEHQGVFSSVFVARVAKQVCIVKLIFRTEEKASRDVVQRRARATALYRTVLLLPCSTPPYQRRLGHCKRCRKTSAKR